MSSTLALILSVLLLAGGCGAPAPETREAPPPAASPRAPAAGPAHDAAARPRIVMLGDSLTAGLGLPSEQSLPAQLQRLLDQAGFAYEVVNAGVSGDTTAGGLRRFDWAVAGDVRILIVALGGNDGLRGLPPEQLQTNLDAIITRAQARGIDVLLAGMEAPPNFGPRYTSEFRSVYRDLADAHGIELLPFLLQGVAGDPSLNQRDGIHPNAEGTSRVAELVWEALRPMLARGSTAAAGSQMPH